MTTSVAHVDHGLARSVARLIDRVATDRVLVFGSLPPDGRDLDILVLDDELPGLRHSLKDAGLMEWGDTLVTFRDCSAYAVDAVPATRWGLPGDEVRRLFREARPLPGSTWLVRPSPADVLLIASRRGVGTTRALSPRWETAIAEALSDDPDCWRTARRSASAWDETRRLRALARAWRTSQSSSTSPWRTPPAWPARLGSIRGRSIRRRRRGAVVTLSGLDGSGKSTQANALAHCLDRLGIEAVIVWRPVARITVLGAAARIGKALLAPHRERRTTPDDQERGASGDRGPDPLQGRPRLTDLWVFVTALASSLSLWWGSAIHLARGRVVIFDRYRLDTVMHLYARHDRERTFSAHERVIRALTPKPLRSYLLDVDPATAYRRKPSRYDLRELATRNAIYRRDHERWQVRRLDGELPPEQLCAEIASDTWRALMRRRDG